ncbi:EndoU domain-containing protein [Micromonospora sp. HUAS YX12]|uniref:EndoU domain-containing protein n=1 Tax=Micromonospora sp. HUAS YX12 TaxID=3156396 RepID=UPI0032ED2FA3
MQDDGGVWRQKRGSSTFFPDNWTPQRVEETIEGAFRSGGPHPDDPHKWQGRATGCWSKASTIPVARRGTRLGRFGGR